MNYIGNAPAPADTLPQSQLAIFDYIAGFRMVNGGAVPVGSLFIEAGQASDSTNVVMCRGQALTKSVAAWAPGNAGGKLSAAAIVANGWYYFYAIRKDSDGSVDYGFDVSSVAPTLPVGYTYWRYIGARKAVAAANDWVIVIQHGDANYWYGPTADLTGSNPGTGPILRVMNVPPGKVVEAIFSMQLTIATVGLAMNLNDTATFDFGGPSANYMTIEAVGQPNLQTAGVFRLWTDTNRQIRSRQSTGDAGAVHSYTTLGWIDPRGRSGY